jgi:hypothetical protein
MMAKHWNSIVVHRPQIYQILGFLLILILLAAVLSTYQGLLILKVDVPAEALGKDCHGSGWEIFWLDEAGFFS